MLNRFLDGWWIGIYRKIQSNASGYGNGRVKIRNACKETIRKTFSLSRFGASPKIVKHRLMCRRHFDRLKTIGTSQSYSHLGVSGNVKCDWLQSLLIFPFLQLSFSPTTPGWSHFRLIALLSSIFSISVVMIVVSIVFGLFNGINMFAFMGAEVSI